MEKILIVDDDPDALALLQLILKKKGFQTATAMQEQEIFEKVATEAPHLILMDVLLSGADGRHICRQLKASEHSAIPIVMLSAHPAAQKGMSTYGADDFLPKPFQESDLLQKIEKFLRRKASPLSP